MRSRNPPPLQGRQNGGLRFANPPYEPTNQKGAVLELSRRQVGLMANADLSGLAITLK
jgi:hypothetical protein